MQVDLTRFSRRHLVEPRYLSFYTVHEHSLALRLLQDLRAASDFISAPSAINKSAARGLQKHVFIHVLNKRRANNNTNVRQVSASKV